MARLSPKTRLTPTISVIALVVVIAAAAVTVAFFVIFRSPSTAAATGPGPLPPFGIGSAKPAARAKPAESARRAAPAKPAQSANRAASTKPVVARQAANGLPTAVARALQRHDVVVVSLYASDVAADRITRGESSAGARDARAGFVALNVLDRKQSEPLALETGVIEAPGTLVFRRPARLVLHLDGFADRVTVAQAVTDARS